MTSDAKNLLKKIAGLIILIGCIAGGVAYCVYNRGVKIDEKTFPDETFRTYLLEKQDHNKDKWLRKDQIDFIKSISLEGCDNLQGIENFTGLTSLSLTNCKDVSEVESVTSLKSLTLTDCKNVSIDFSKLTSLERLIITNCEISYDIDFSGLQYINEIKIEDSTVGSLTFIGCPILDSIYLHTSTADKLLIENCLLIHHVTVDEVQNITSIVLDDCPEMWDAYFVDCPDLNELALRKCNRLTIMNIIGCDLIKEVDMRGCEYIWQVFNTPDALKTTDSSNRSGYITYYRSDDELIRHLKLPQIRIHCKSDVELITK